VEQKNFSLGKGLDKVLINEILLEQILQITIFYNQ
jgi:hypothetical protein